MKLLIGLLVIGAVAVGTSLDRQRLREKGRVPRPDIDRWEEEGGAVAAEAARTAAGTDSVQPAAPF
ncbi:MAG TPA: hypothetical protein VIL32_01220 [Steroidobacteraceae bacterium]